ncbi:TIGR04452 family lipoprotein [Leptospira saintgironsiae]|uniref:TIGR04452 family lipoprotein n=1 Tax=Leptospira saintgironsiae TaxID=2023183 RepID=UPI001FCAFF7D|nr:TIGR04452 family lipoprotein [Leptospira saintgironsiae]
MKKANILLTTLLYAFLTSCIVVDTLGLTDTYKGDVAKRKLIDAAMIGDSLTARAAFTAQKPFNFLELLQTLIHLLLT